MNTKHLISFITTAQCRSITRAASKLNYAQSTIHEHIYALETELGCELYTRLSKGIALTDAGQKFYSYALQLIDLYYETTHAMSGKQSESIHIGASASSDHYIISPLLKEYLKKFPDVEIDYNKMTTDVSLSKVPAGLCDLCFVCETTLSASEVNIQYLCTISDIFVTRPRHPAVLWGIHSPQNSGATMLGTMTLTSAKMMLSTVGLDYDDLFDSLLNIGGFDHALEIILEKQVIALLPSSLVQPYLDSGTLVRLPELMHTIDLNVYIITHKKKPLSPAAQEFMHLAFEMFGSKGARPKTV